MQGSLLLVGVNRLGMAVVFGGDDLEELTALADPLIYYAVYRNEPNMVTTTQEEFLVTYRDDPYWERKHEGSPRGQGPRH